MAELLSHRNLQNVVKELNSKFGSKLKPITTRENFISQILETIGNASKEQQEMLTPDAVDVYNALLSVPPVNAVSNEEELEDMCPAYGVAYDKNDPECQACDKPEECQELTLKNAAAKSGAKKEKPVKKEKKETVKVEVAKSRYGHKVGSMAAVLDDMVWEGSTLSDMVTAIMDGFGKDEAKATNKVKGHLVWLKREKKVVIVKDGDVYKATTEAI